MSLTLKNASFKHLAALHDLVNLAYRGSDGWTKETRLISGHRVTKYELETHLANANSHLLIATNKGKVAACICIERKRDCAYFSLFAVHPNIQNTGVGKNILSQAENFARDKLGVKDYVMSVISQREELISYYERRGYSRTGNIEDYPIHLNVGTPLKSGLTIEYLKKKLEE